MALPPSYTPPSFSISPDNKGWKSVGYRGLSSWMASDPDFFLLRRFDRLNTRILLHMQDEIAQEEEKLEKIDKEREEQPLTGDEFQDFENGYNGSFRDDPSDDRKELIEKLKPRLKAYNESVIAYSAMRSRHTASDHQYRNMTVWFSNNEGVISDDEIKWKDQRGDLISIVDKPRLPILMLVDRITRGKLRKILELNLFKTRPLKGRHLDSPTSSYYSNTAKDVVSSSAIVFTGLLLLFGPLWWLNWVSDRTKRLGIITGAVIIFTAFFLGTKSNGPFEVMAGSAAYAAVLMVFMQISNR